MSQFNRLLSTPMRWLLTGRRKPEDEAGQGLAEYALMLSLVAVVAITALTGFGVKVASMISDFVAAF